MKFVVLCLTFLFFEKQASFYEMKIIANDEKEILLNEFKGSKILFVNIGTKSEYRQQLWELDVLSSRFAEKLIIIVFPTNDFGTETMSDYELGDFLKRTQKFKYYVTQKAKVTGEDAHPVYKWLTSKKLNNSLDSKVRSDFQKYLVNEEGELIGVFPGNLSPTNDQIVSLLK